jgi:hypothetical protein
MLVTVARAIAVYGAVALLTFATGTVAIAASKSLATKSVSSCRLSCAPPHQAIAAHRMHAVSHVALRHVR